MAEVTVKAPDSSFEGSVAGITFVKGVAKVDRKANPGAYQYFQSAGYEVDGKTVTKDAPGRYEARPTPAAPAPGTPDNPDGIDRGPASKDAAIVKDAAGPWSDAFLPPTNAGEADPHGPEVVSPGLHAVPPAPIVPGPVSPEPPKQERAETEVATQVLVDGEDARIVADPFTNDDGVAAPAGPLGLSDPASAEEGERLAKESDAPSAADLEREAAADRPAPARASKRSPRRSKRS